MKKLALLLVIFALFILAACGEVQIDVESVREIVVEDGVTGINSSTFGQFPNVEKVTLGKDVLYIGSAHRLK